MIILLFVGFMLVMKGFFFHQNSRVSSGRSCQFQNILGLMRLSLNPYVEPTDECCDLSMLCVSLLFTEFTSHEASRTDIIRPDFSVRATNTSHKVIGMPLIHSFDLFPNFDHPCIQFPTLKNDRTQSNNVSPNLGLELKNDAVVHESQLAT